jgi:hypothetical protein
VREDGGNFALASLEVRLCVVVLSAEGRKLTDCLQESIERVEVISEREEPLPVFLVQERLDQLHIGLRQVVRHVAVDRLR